ncbi:hypothetical protein ACINK0_04590 [Deinococcus sp. VB343]|uniref:hypothetical protein n=1 Tax=Deinococcus sp. VB343 TaxID=3385567 RepID=UPI0039C9B73F
MTPFTPTQLSEAHRALASTLSKCEKVLAGGKLKPAQHTLTRRRIEALRTALALIEREQSEQV